MPAPSASAARRTLVLGCGNVLYGDDGFGPAVADLLLAAYRIPDDATVVNLGLATRGYLFDVLLADDVPERIVVVDAMEREGGAAGEVFEVPLDALSPAKVDDFSFHQGPTSNLLRELRDLRGVDVVVVSCHPGRIPAEMEQGLTAEVAAAVREAATLVYDRYLTSRRRP